MLCSKIGAHVTWAGREEHEFLILPPLSTSGGLGLEVRTTVPGLDAESFVSGE